MELTEDRARIGTQTWPILPNSLHCCSKLLNLSRPQFTLSLGPGRKEEEDKSQELKVALALQEQRKMLTIIILVIHHHHHEECHEETLGKRLVSLLTFRVAEQSTGPRQFLAVQLTAAPSPSEKG